VPDSPASDSSLTPSDSLYTQGPIKVFRRSTGQLITVHPPHTVDVAPHPEKATPEMKQSIAGFVDGDACLVLVGRDRADSSYDRVEVRFNASAANVVGNRHYLFLLQDIYGGSIGYTDVTI
jgi:hypothetical protein